MKNGAYELSDVFHGVKIKIPVAKMKGMKHVTKTIVLMRPDGTMPKPGDKDYGIS